MIGYLEKTKDIQTKKTKPEKTTKPRGIKHRVLKTSEILKGLFASRLDGWKDDKEKFKTELINDIKSFLFGKWEKPWKAGLIFDEDGKVLSGFRNISGRLYKNSSNILSMERNSGKSPYFITIAALKNQGGKLIDKSKVLSVLSYIPMFKDMENKTPRQADWMLPKLHSAVNVDYCEGVKKPIIKEVSFIDHELNEYVENFLKELIKKKRVPKIYNDQADRCFYGHLKLSFSKESIHMVDFKQFHQIDSYYSVLFHEITHSTKNPKRLGRGKLGATKTLKYANEELVAEMGAMIICTELGLKYSRRNSLVYLKGWLKSTKGDIDENLLEAYGFACDAAEYLLEGINLAKLVPKSMQDRAKENEQETLEERSLKKKKEPGPSKVKKETSRKEQLSLWGLNNVNNEFNKRLNLLIKGDLKNKAPFNLGMPSKSLLSTKVPLLPIEISVTRLTKKSMQKNHPFDLKSLKNLPNAIANPIAIFKSKTQKNSKIILTELKQKDVSFVIALEVERTFKQGVKESKINSIRSIYPRKPISQILKWVCKDGLLEWVDEKKALNWINKQQCDSADVIYLIECSVNIIQNFNKPKLQNKTDLKGLNENVTSLSDWKPNTHIISLKTDLGKFIGGYERNRFAMVVRGEKGAGKTRLLCQVINLFASQALNCLFKSLEVSPESELFGSYTGCIEAKNKDHIFVDANTSLKTLEEQCKIYDCIAIDSWGKLDGIDQTDFGRLVEKYPKVIWLVIFQSTTNGTARGGIMSEYDSSLVVQVTKGGDAICEKNRYNSTDLVYNVFQQELIQTENES